MVKMSKEAMQFVAAQDQYAKIMQERTKSIGWVATGLLSDKITACWNRAAQCETDDSQLLLDIFGFAAYGLAQTMADLAESGQDIFDDDN
jgi:hypothetical protein